MDQCERRLNRGGDVECGLIDIWPITTETEPHSLCDAALLFLEMIFDVSRGSACHTLRASDLFGSRLHHLLSNRGDIPVHGIHNTLVVVLISLYSALAAWGQTDIMLGEGRQPQVAVGPTGNAFVVHAKDGVVRVNSSSDGGKSFGESVVVDTVAGLPLGMRRGPRIAVTKDAVVITAIGGEKGGGKDGDIFAWVSVDQGKKWTRSAKPVNTVHGSAREGMHGMAAGADGTLACVWLDLRNVKPGKPGTEVWCALSKDGGRTWSQEKAAYRNPGGTVCECCHPSVAVDEQGVITIMFRNAVAGARDMYVTVSKDGGKTFSAGSKLGTGLWKLNACPMDGGAVTVHGAKVTTIWRRDKTLYVNVPGEPEQSIASGTQPVIVAATDGLYSLWMEGSGLMYQVPGQAAESLSKSGGYPTIACAPDGKGPVVAAWERDGNVVIRTVKPR